MPSPGKFQTGLLQAKIGRDLDGVCNLMAVVFKGEKIPGEDGELRTGAVARVNEFLNIAKDQIDDAVLRGSM